MAIANISEPNLVSNSVNNNSISSRFHQWLNKTLHTPFNSALKEDQRDFFQKLNRHSLERMGVQMYYHKLKGKDANELQYISLSKPDNTKTKFLVHGSGSNYYKADRALYLLDKGYNVALVSYRGHSANPWSSKEKPLIRMEDNYKGKTKIIEVPQGDKMEESIVDDVYRQLTHFLTKNSIENKDLHFEGSSLGVSILSKALSKYSQSNPYQRQPFGSFIMKAAPIDLITDKKDIRSKSLGDLGLTLNSDVESLINDAWNIRDDLAKLNISEIKLLRGSNDNVVPTSHTDEIYRILSRNNQNISSQVINGEKHSGFNLNKYEIY